VDQEAVLDQEVDLAKLTTTIIIIKILKYFKRKKILIN